MTDQSNTNFEATTTKGDSLTNAPAGPVTFGASSGGLFFSEYIEGSSNNKAVEIFNNTGAAVDLSDYAIGRISNGGTDVEAAITLSGTLAAGATYVVANTGADATILAAADLTSGSLSHNGDDHLLLLTDIGGGTTIADGARIVDMIGTPDSGSGFVDPGSQWESNGNETADQTLRRVSSVTEGSADGFGADVAKLGTEWEEFAIDTFDGLGSHSVDAADPQPTVINEVLMSTTSNDVEFIEIYGEPGASLDGLSVLNIESNDASGDIDNQFDMPAGAVIGENGFYLIGNSLVAGALGVTPNAILPDNFFENSSSTIALVETATISGGTVDGTETVIDAIGVTDGTAGTFYYDAEVLGPDGSYYPSAVGRTTDGGDTWALIDAFSPAGNNTTPTAGTFTLAYTDYMIHDVQGETNLADLTVVGSAGDADESPLLGAGVRVQGIVTAAFQDAGDIMGFYIQEEDADADDNAFTSEGIFVASSSVTVAVGDLVTVEGTVAEVEGETRIIAADVTIDSSDNALPTATSVSFPTATVLTDADGDYVANLEAYEGMLITIDTQMFVTELFQHDRFNTIRISSDGRLEQFTESNTPDVAGYDQHLQDVAARSLVLDDGSDGQNVNPMEAPDLGDITNANYLTMGDTYDSLTGVLGYSEDDQSSSEEPEYRLRDATGTWTSNVSDTETPQDVGSDYKVASLNVLNFFTTLDEYPNVGEGSGPNALDPRGADANPQNADPIPGATDEYDRQLAKLVSAIVGMDADVVGLMEIENDFATGGTAPTGTGTVIGSGVAISELVDAVNAELGDTVYGFVDPGQEFVGGDAIAVGFIYKTTTTGLAAGTTVEILDTAAFLDPNNTGEDRNRAAIAATFEELASGETFTAAVNHLKSKGASGLSAGDAGNPDSDQGDGAGFWNDTRTKAAQALTDWLATDPTGSGDADVILLGDYNAYAMEDPIAALEAGADDTPGTDDDFYNYIDAPEYDHTHTYVFDGQTGTLDYAFLSRSLGDQATGVTVWSINADQSDAFDYNLEFGRDPSLYDAGADRSSDHDPVIIGLELSTEQDIRISVGDVTADSAVFLGNDELDGDLEINVYTEAGLINGIGVVSLKTAGSGTPGKYDYSGLSSNTQYWYEVTDAFGNSSVGTFTTAASNEDGQVGLTFGITGDWRGELSPYSAIANADDANLDFMLLGGDTIYADDESLALPGVDQATTLDEFRAKYEEVYNTERGGANFWDDLFKTTSIFATIDDHEVANDFAGGGIIGTTDESEFRDLFPGDDVNDFVNDSTLFENGLQIFHEQHAIRDEFYGDTGDDRTANERKLYRSQEFGQDAALMVLDQRSFRDEQITDAIGSVDPVEIAAFQIASFDDTRTMLGDAQLTDLLDDLQTAQDNGVTWKFVFTPEPMQDLGLNNADSWEGYKAERTEILSYINDNDITNVVFVAADIHGTFVNNLTYSETPLGQQIATSAFEITTGSVAYDAPFGPVLAATANLTGVLTDEQYAFYNALPIAPDGDGQLNDKDDFIANAFNTITLDPLGLDHLGLDDNLAQADGLINAELLQGGWVSAHTFGWTEFDIDADTQDLTVTTYGIDAYDEAAALADPAAIAALAPRIVSQFVVQADLPPEIYTLELLHVTDQEANASTIDNIDNLSAVLNALRAQDLGNDGVADNTLTLSSGDAIIPGLFFDASEAVFGSAGIADIQIQNELGMQAIAFGNHEFDNGTGFIAGLIDGSATGDFSALSGTALDGLDFTGTDMPYLSANLDFGTDPNLAPLEVAGGQAPQGNVVTSSTVIEEGGEKIGIVGATTPLIDQISSAGNDLGIFPEDFDTNPTSEQLDALASVIQAEVDALLAANPEMNKVILLAHMQQIEIEQDLAARLTDVDIIVAGGSNTRLFDDNDRARDGDSDQGQYPILVTDAGGNTTAIVNTDAQYKYVGRLVIDFDENGHIIEDSYDETVSGAYATDDQGVADLGAEALVDPEIDAITDAIQAQIVATESNVFGVSDVFLNGNRSGTGTADDPDGVRTQETNLGNLTADANLAYANDMVTAHGLGDPVLVSIKNGGGIRANIGQIVVPGGGGAYVRGPNEAVFDETGAEVKPEGGISQNDIASVLAFNNGLSLVDMTKQELVDTLEGGVSALPSVNGGFPQISGVKFSFDPTATAGDRIQEAVIVDDNGDIVDILVRDGEIFGATDTVYRVVTLNFLLDFGDPILSPLNEANLSNPNRVDLFDLDGDEVDDGATTGAATFSDDGTEQDALAEYLNANFNPATGGTAYDEADAGPDTDGRIQNLTFRAGDVIDPNETLYGTNNADVISGRDGEDTIFGLQGNDVLRGGTEDDHLVGNAGRDLLVGGEGADILDGGNDFDFAHYRASSAGVTIDLRSNTFTGGDAQGDTLIRIEGIGGSMFDDVLGGTADRNVIEGYDGDDQIFGRGGNDLLIGGAGADLLNGGSGTDRVDYADSAAAVSLNLITNIHTGGDAAGDNLISIEQLVGSDFADTIIGSDRADLLIGGTGDDFLNGRNRADKIIGGLGDDIMKGGNGADTFRFVEAQFGQDEIRDFEDGRDMLDFRALNLTYADFTKTQVGTHTLLELTADTDQSVILKNIDATLIDAFDFM